MFIRLLDCIRTDHDPWLVVLALAVSLVSGFTFFTVLAHARDRCGRGKVAWSLMAALVAGIGIWSTHFVAMLGFHPASIVSYDIVPTVASAAIAILLAGAATPFLLSAGWCEAVGGASLLAAAIGAMHFIGMTALDFAGTLHWRPSLVAVSLALGAVLTASAVFAERRSASSRQRVVAGGLFGVAICALHFTAMAAAVAKSDPAHLVSTGGLSEFLLGLAVALTTSSIVALSLATVALDQRAEKAWFDADEMRSVIQACRQAHEQMAYFANHDTLTGLPNRRLFSIELQRAVELADAARGKFGLLWIDLDRFKHVNDAHGHAIGDSLLCEVAGRLRCALEDGHLLARIGGDEFVVLCRPSPDASDPVAVAQRLLRAMAQPISIDGRILDVAASIGVADYPSDAASIEALMRAADLALYEAKRTGRGRWSRAA